MLTINNQALPTPWAMSVYRLQPNMLRLQAGWRGLDAAQVQAVAGMLAQIRAEAGMAEA